MNIYAYVATGILALALLAGTYWTGHVVGAHGVLAEWNAETSARNAATTAAVLKRVQENAVEMEKNRENNQLIKKAHDDQLSQLRNAIATSPKLRIGPALCSGFTGASETASTSGSDTGDTARRILSQEMDDAIKSLIMETEAVAATGRACQAFVLALEGTGH